MKDIAGGDEIVPNIATNRDLDDAARPKAPQSIETSTTTVVAPTTSPYLTREAAVALAKIIRVLTRDARDHRAA
jgi:hypothetical protein